MYNNVYQDYINNILGWEPRIQNNFEYETYRNSNYSNMQLEKFYPELYKVLYPMIQTACMRNTKPITEENINEMVNEIYSNFNADDVTVLNINLNNDVRSSKMGEISKSSTSKSSVKISEDTRNVEERNIKPNNYVLNDLIRILLIRELLGKTGNSAQFDQGLPFYAREAGAPQLFSIGNIYDNIYEYI